MRAITRRVSALEHRRAAEPEAWLEAHVESRYDLDAWYGSLAETERAELERLDGTALEDLSTDECEFMAGLAERLQANLIAPSITLF